MTTRTQKITAAEFWAMPEDPGHRYELVDGELVDLGGSPVHGIVTGSVGSLLLGHVEETGLPWYVGVAVGFKVNDFTVRVIDVNATQLARMAGYDEDSDGFPDFAPDVAVEVVARGNELEKVERKVAEYLACGTRAAWIVEPKARSVKVRRSGTAEQVFGPDDTLSGEPEIPGFACPVADVFAALDRRPKREARMTTATAPAIAEETTHTDLDLPNLPDDRRHELIDGELVELPPMRRAPSIVTSKISRLFDQHIEDENLLFWVGSGASFRLGLPSANFRIPDVSVTAERPGTPSIEDEPGVWEGSPDIAVEVVSLTDAYVDVIDKARLYLRQGVATVLLVDAYNREVAVRQSTGEIRVLTANDILTGEPVLPGFSCSVAEIFSGLDRVAALRTEAN